MVRTFPMKVDPMGHLPRCAIEAFWALSMALGDRSTLFPLYDLYIASTLVAHGHNAPYPDGRARKRRAFRFDDAH